MEIFDQISPLCINKGFQLHHFKVGWYNDQVAEVFKLPYSYDTAAAIILSLPEMFELNFVPFLKTSHWNNGSDPLDQSIAHFVNELKQSTALRDETVDTYYDYEMVGGTRRPRILVQTAGHVAGAAFFYQQSAEMLASDPKQKKLFGVGIHPDYGGWFAFRSVLILPEKTLPPKLKMSEPPDTVPESDQIKLLEFFNYSWQTGEYRNIVEPKSKYSQSQIDYFNTPPKDRNPLIEKLIQEGNMT